MKNKFQHTIVATALLALGFAAAPAPAAVAADKITSYVEIARSVFGGDKTAAEAVSAAAKDKATAGEIAAAVAAAQVAKEDAAPEVLAGIAGAAGDFASRAAATVAAVTGADIASALSDPAVADAAKDPGSVLSGSEKADLKDLYEKVLAALKGAGYKMKGDGDSAKGKGKGKKAKDKDKDKDAKDAAAGDAAADADAAKADTDAKDGGSDGYALEGVSYDSDENLGDPVDQTEDDPYVYRTTPTTLSGVEEPVLVPVVVPVSTPSHSTSKPKPSKPEEPVYMGTGGKTTMPSPTPVGLH